MVIDGTSVEIQPDWRIDETLNERNTMRFRLLSLDGTYRPASRAEIAFYVDSVLYFAGHIHQSTEGGLGGYGVAALNHQFGAVDYNALPDRRQVELTLAAGTLKSWLQNEIEELVAIYGVTLDPAQVTGDTYGEVVFERGMLTDLLNNISVISGYAWEIDYTKVLRMFAPGTTAAPFDIADGDGHVIGDLTVTPTLTDYANRIRVLYTTPASEAYAFFKLTANAGDTETATIGSEVYTFLTSPVGGNDVQIGASTADTIDNFIAKIYPAHDEVVASEQASDTVRVTASTAGAAGNGIQVSTTCANGSWYTEGGGLVSHLVLGADAALTGVATAEDAGEQSGGANLFEKTYTHADITDSTTAQAMADGYLVKHLFEPREIRYRTHTAGLHPGMQQYIECSERNVDAACLITSVGISAAGQVLVFDITATEGLVITPSYQEKWRENGGRAA